MLPAEHTAVATIAVAELSEAIKRVAAGKPLEGHDDVFSKAAGQAVEPTEAEKEFWDGVKDSTDADEIALYIEQFPHGAFVALAKKKIAALGGK